MARLVVGALVAADPPFDEERGDDLRLAVSEACTNAIQAELAVHPDGADSDPSGSPIVMRCVLVDGHITVTVTISAISRDGKAMTFAGAADGGWFGEGSVLKDEARKYDIVARPRHANWP